ncbi:MAG: type I-E CRISPR-associated protein Cas5/CasD [Pseudomonadota bacterium]
MTHAWLHLRFAAPLMAFGGVAIDQVGPTREFPAASALTGLLANALGWRREERDRHQALQERLIFGALTVRPGRRITHEQNAKLEKSDKGWTTHGAPEGRAGATYDTPHRRRRDYHADRETHVVLRVVDSASPTLDEIAAALERPARPLFFGRKPCLPAGPLLRGRVEAGTARQALSALNRTGTGLWPDEGDRPEGPVRRHDLPDLRDWRTGLHAGRRIVCEGAIG